ncbi:hypothetical protein SAMN05444159_0364 [Bradyrhizobium lablabi]|uniref:N-acetyltransferase domain-containing protein n=2 Tax=Bradyrhizobium lablabi TaxID=722472 RepID=A0A1M6IHS1_9BRAD|nr:hypothetical protein SAMN05444159_0364 [Bradyrhizobium lablabi]
MRNETMERACFAARHDFDSLPISSDVEVRPARYQEISILADMAHRLVPGVQMTAPMLGKYFAFDPECILTFSRREQLLGGIAFLYLNSRGHDALILDEICLTQPDISLLAPSDEEVSAIYLWALAATGRGVAASGKISAHLRTRRYVNANCFAQPSTKAGRDWLISTCFKQIPSFQPDLWCYERPWNRVPTRLAASGFPARSSADAWH